MTPRQKLLLKQLFFEFNSAGDVDDAMKFLESKKTMLSQEFIPHQTAAKIRKGKDFFWLEGWKFLKKFDEYLEQFSPTQRRTLSRAGDIFIKYYCERYPSQKPQDVTYDDLRILYLEHYDNDWLGLRGLGEMGSAALHSIFT